MGLENQKFEKLGVKELSKKLQLRIPDVVIEHLSLESGNFVVFYKTPNDDIIMMKAEFNAVRKGKVVEDGGK